MSKVNVDDITYPYINIRLESDEISAKLGKNLSHLYLYIDKYMKMGSIFKYGNAYRAIKKQANILMSRNNKKISKRQVASLRKFYTILGSKRHIKIPYTSYYIFKAIFVIVDTLKVEHPLPHDLEIFVGKIRREIFYKEQSEIFEEWYNNNNDNKNELTRGLHDDIFAGNAILGKKF